MFERMTMLLLSRLEGQTFENAYRDFTFSVSDKFGLFIDGKDYDTLGPGKTAHEYMSGDVDSVYNTWLHKYSDNEAVFTAIGTYLGDLQNNGTLSTQAETDCVRRLNDLLGKAKELKEAIDDLKNHEEPSECRQALIKVETSLNALNGNPQQPGLEETLREFNKATGFRFVKDGEMKALSLLSNQVNRILLEADRSAGEQINTGIAERLKEQEVCEQKVTEYNQGVVEYFEALKDVDGDSREAKLKTIGAALEGINNVITSCEQDEAKYNKEIETIPGKIEKEKAALAKMEKKYKESKSKISDSQEKLDEAKSIYLTKEKKLNELKRQLEQEEKDTVLKQVRSKMDKATDEQKRWLGRIEKNDQMIESYKKTIADIQKGMEEYDENIDRQKYSDYPDKEKPNYSAADEARGLELKDAKKTLHKLGGNHRLLDGKEIYTRKEIDALIESLRINSDEDIEDLAKDGTEHTEKLSGYLGILKEYAAQYDTLHKGEQPVSVSGKMRFSYARSCSVGTKAAIDLLNGLLPESKKAPVVISLAEGLRAGINKLGLQVEEAMRFNGPLYRAMLEMDKKNLYANQNKKKLEDCETSIKLCELDSKKAIQEIERLSQTVSDERDKDEATKEQEMKMAQSAKMTAMKEKIAKAELTLQNAKAKMESRQRAIDTKTEAECNRLSKDIEQKNAAIAKLNENLKTAQKNKEDVTNNKVRYEARKNEWLNRQNTEQEKYQVVGALKKECTKRLQKLDDAGPSLKQPDNRIRNVAQQINAFLADVENGNTKKSDGSWDHKNGKHYSDLKTALETFKAQLDDGNMSLQQVAASLQDLQEKAQSYLDTRGKDWSRVFSSGSHFRHARLGYVTSIRNFCNTTRPFFSDTRTPLNLQEETKLMGVKVNELCPEISMANIGQIGRNLHMEDKPLPNEQPVEEGPSASVQKESMGLGNGELNESVQANVDENALDEENSVLNESTYTQYEGYEGYEASEASVQQG